MTRNRLRCALMPQACSGLEPEHATEPSVDIGHEGWWQVPGLDVQVGLVQSDQGGDVDHGVFGQAGRGGRQEDVARHRCQASIGRDHGGQGGVQPAAVERVGLDDQDRTPLGWPAAARFSQIGPADTSAADLQSSPAASRLRPAAAAAAAESAFAAACSASLTCSVSERDASSSR